MELEVELSDPYGLFKYAIKSQYTREQYTIRLRQFFKFVGLQGTVEEQCHEFVTNCRKDLNWSLRHIMRFLQWQRERVEKKELSVATVHNSLKPIKLFCDMNELPISIMFWKKLTRGIPRSRKWADDRAPTLEEIRIIVEYPDRRIKAIVYTMVSSGIRVGAWDFLKWGHITKLEGAARIRVYAGEADEYFTYITPEAYKVLEAWINFRKRAGEVITKDSWVMRNLWDVRGVAKGKGAVTMPRKLSINGMKTLIRNAIWAQGVHVKLQPGKTHAEQVMKPIHVEMLMGHSTGISDSYYRPAEKDLLEDYMKVVPLLTIESVAATEEQLQKRMDSKVLELTEQINKISQVAESNYKSYEKPKQEIDEYRKELEEKDERRDKLYDMLDEEVPGWGERYHRLLGWGGRPLTKEERKKVKLLLEQIEEKIRNNPDADYYED